MRETVSEMKSVLSELGLSTLDATTQFLLVAITALSIAWHMGCTVGFRYRLVDFDRFMGEASADFRRSADTARSS